MSDIAYLWDEVDDDLVSRMMIAITKKIHESGSEIVVQGVLGGEFGYGAHYKNDVFEMRPFYWGDCRCDYEDALAKWEEENDHDKDCYQTIFRAMHYKEDGYEYKDGHGWNDECGCVETVYKMFKINPNTPGSYVHCTCMYSIKWDNFNKTIAHSDICEVDKPNFKHYNSGIEIEWYKYIGRSMDYDNDVDGNTFVEMFKECMESIGVNNKT